MSPLFPNIPDAFLAWFAAYGRIEARSRSKDFTEGLAARIADPAWLLARQWQMGEFQREDAGTPIAVELEHFTQALGNVKLGSDPATQVPTGPLEKTVEREAVGLSLRDRILIAQEYERLIGAVLAPDRAQAVITDARARYPLPAPDDPSLEQPPDAATQRLLGFMGQRSFDGAALLADIERGHFGPKPLPGSEAFEILSAKTKLRRWCTQSGLSASVAGPPAWRNEQLDYRFELNALEAGGGNTHLRAASYRNGDLEWHAFTRAGPLTGEWTVQPLRTPTPSRITVAGASPRWWAFEDGATDFGKLDTARPDLTKLALMEFALVYGDDWFSVPLDVQMGNLVRITRLSVIDVFGERTQLLPATIPAANSTAGWEVFTLSAPGLPRDASEASVLLVSPTLSHRQESLWEEVRFIRDEGANMVWGIERRVRDGASASVDGSDAARERVELRRQAAIAKLQAEVEALENQLAALGLSDEQRAALEADRAARLSQIAVLRDGPRASAGGISKYRLSTTVPENWIPFVPVDAAPFRGQSVPSMRLLRARMLRDAEGENVEPITARTRLLELGATPLIWLAEEQVPRTGRRVQLTAQRTRWVDGTTHVWVGRKVLTGRGEGASGLRFDVLAEGVTP